jgi:hypothetical protein
MRSQRWPQNRSEIEQVERVSYLLDEVEYERTHPSEEYESERDYVDRMRRQAEWDEEERREQQQS